MNQYFRYTSLVFEGPDCESDTWRPLNEVCCDKQRHASCGGVNRLHTSWHSAKNCFDIVDLFVDSGPGEDVQNTIDNKHHNHDHSIENDGCYLSFDHIEMTTATD